MNKGSLTLVGTGIKFLAHLTLEAKVYLENSDKVFFLINEPAFQQWILEVNPNAESLDELYFKHFERKAAYQAIAQHVLNDVRKGDNVCFAIYGHPTVFSQPGLTAIQMAMEEGYHVNILPGISAEDCIFTDLRINPGDCGCQSFEATDFLVYRRKWDNRSHLILWQVDVVGILTHAFKNFENKKRIQILVEYLYTQYSPDHKIILYEASQYPHIASKMLEIQLSDLSVTELSPLVSVYIPPSSKALPEKNILMALNISNYSGHIIRGFLSTIVAG